VDQRFAEYSKQTGIEESRIREYYGQAEQISRLTYTITEEKVIQFLTQSAKIKEVPAAALTTKN
jgi:trigger factor